MTAIDKVTVEFVKLRDGGKCVRCGDDDHDGLTMRRQIIKTPNDTMQNLSYICVPCGVWLPDHPRLARSYGFQIPPNVDPAAVPIDSYEHGWVLLRADGSWVPAHEDVVERWLDECTWARA